MERTRPNQQVYDHYTAEDFKVWKILFERQSELVAEYASKAYLQSLAAIGFSAAAIPRFSEINQVLAKTTGRTVTVVEGHVPPKDFFRMLAGKIFPATCWLRTWSELDYIEEPDMFHDIFGHVPLLTDKVYSDFLQSFGRLALHWHEDAEKIEMLSRIYWFTIEFGIMMEAGLEKIYGAGILSSPGETKFSMSQQPAKSRFNTARVLATSFKTDSIQEQYFSISGFEQLQLILAEVQAAFGMAPLAKLK